jgi:hypothetical protein
MMFARPELLHLFWMKPGCVMEASLRRKPAGVNSAFEWFASIRAIRVRTLCLGVLVVKDCFGNYFAGVKRITASPKPCPVTVFA